MLCSCFTFYLLTFDSEYCSLSPHLIFSNAVVILVVLDFVFFSIQCELFLCPEKGTGCSEHLTILIVRLFSHF